MIIHLIRHTTPDIEAGVCYGQSDVPLADSFETESEKIVDKLFNSYDAIYSSPLQRCAILSMRLNGKSRFTDDRLLEYDFGDWELMRWDSLTSVEAQDWMSNFVHQPAPQGESMLIMQKRVQEFWSELINSDLTSVAIVTHAGVLRLIHGLIFETAIDKLFRLQLDYGAILEVNSDQKSGLITVKYL